MANCFLATDSFLSSLDIIDHVGLSISSPEALKSAQLPVTNAISCACVVILSGYFENFLKDVIREYIESVNGLGKPLCDIPFSMQYKHYSGGAEALTWASKRDKDLGTTAYSQDLTRRLGSLDQAVGYALAWEAFANTKSNPGADTVSALLSGLEVEKAWTEINGLQTEHGRLDTFLTSFIKMRNVCAHTGRHPSPPSGGDILGYVEKFRALACCIDMLMGIRLERFN
jgi:hypothetical protein